MGSIRKDCRLVNMAKEIIDKCDTSSDIRDKIEKATSVLEYAKDRLQLLNNQEFHTLQDER